MVNRRTAAPLRITERVDYALRSVLLLAQHDGDYLTARAVAEHYGMSLKLLGGVLWCLSAAGIVDSRPGWHGGFRLARPPGEISLRTVIAAASSDGSPLVPQASAPLGSSEGDGADDTVVRFWRALDRTVQRTLDGVTVADLAATPGGVRLDGVLGLGLLDEPDPEPPVPEATVP